MGSADRGCIGFGVGLGASIASDGKAWHASFKPRSRGLGGEGELPATAAARLAGLVARRRAPYRI